MKFFFSVLILFTGGIVQAKPAKPTHCVFDSSTIKIGTRAVTVYEAGQVQKFRIVKKEVRGKRTRIWWGQEEDYNVLEYWRTRGSDGAAKIGYPYSAETWVGDTPRKVGGCASSSALPVSSGLNLKLPGFSNQARCKFANPSVMIEVNLKNRAAVMTTPEGNRKFTNLVVRDGGHADIEVHRRTKTGLKLLVHIATIDQGSDGISDHVYDAAAYRDLNDGRVQEGGCDFILALRPK